MKTTLSGKPLSRIGIGTYGIGGRGHRDVAVTECKDKSLYIEAIRYTLTKGSNFTEISAGYGHGNAITLFTEGLKNSKVKREDLFLTNSLYPRDIHNLDTAKNDLETFYSTLETAYADSTLITQSLVSKFGKEPIFTLLHEMLDKDRTRYVSLSNAGPVFIQEFKREFGDKVFAHEGHMSFEVRGSEEVGIFKLCKNLDIVNIIWRPLRRNLTANRNWNLLVELAEKYNKTQNQIILNWLCNLCLYPMIMSADKAHIDENLSSVSFKMTDADYKKIDNFKPQNYNPPEVDWEKSGEGISVSSLATDFEKHITEPNT